MKGVFQMTYKTGTIGDFMKWTKQVVTDPSAAAKKPKQWFDSHETAARAFASTTSAEAMVKLLSPENLALLALIRTKRPDSVHALAQLAHRAESNLSRTLKKLQDAGIIELAKGAGKTRIPRLVAQRVTLDLDLTGSGSVVSVQKPRVR
jgi:predicted transcriptional regulator